MLAQEEAVRRVRVAPPPGVSVALAGRVPGHLETSVRVVIARFMRTTMDQLARLSETVHSVRQDGQGPTGGPGAQVGPGARGRAPP